MDYKYLFLTIILATHYQKSIGADRIVCYYESWSYYSGMKPSDFDWSPCTHINYAFSAVQNDGSLSPSDNDLDVKTGLYKIVTDLKKKHKGLKVLLSIGGDSAEQTKRFASVVGDKNKRKKFVSSARSTCEKYGFDGVDIDWEYPDKKNKDNFITFLTEIKNDFKAKKWLVTAAVSSDVQDGYDAPKLAKILDFINVMSYDFYGSWSTYTGQNSPLYASPVESDWEKSHLNLAASAKNWRNAGVPAKQLSIGTAFYGRLFKLKDPNKHGIHAPIDGAGVGDDGYVNYYDICSKYKSWKRVFDNDQKNPYKYNGNQWIGYDDEQSIKLKANYIKTQKYGGIMIWPVDGDDVHGKCGEKQILLKTIEKEFKK